MIKRLVIFVLFPLFHLTAVNAQSILVIDTTNGKRRIIKPGELLGVITLKDTINPYSYKDTTRENTYLFNPKGNLGIKAEKS